ncbi:MAG: segregation/condensation protein A [Microcystaceae cyanobacterium]
MTILAASEAIATLIDLAEQGHINPWDVSVIEVIDRFLQELGILSSSDLTFQQKNLPRSGQAFLWASLLVRYKADTLEFWGQEPEVEAQFSEEALIDENGQRTLPLNLEQHLRRRTAAPPLKRRRVTLEELIAQIQAIAKEIEKGDRPKSLKRPRPQSRKEALQIITELAHQENLTELAQELDQFLRGRLPEFMTEGDWVELESLLLYWHQHQNLAETPSKKDKVGIFWALLLLSSQSKVELSQEEFYKEIRVQVIP